MADINNFVQALESRRLLSGVTQVTPAPAITHASAVKAVVRAPLPKVYSINPATLVKTKAQIASGKAVLMPAYKVLISSANSALKMTPVSVTDKTNPSGISAHDYVSYARYYWPNPNTKSGLPYINKDGDVNTTQVNKGDVGMLDSLLSGVNSLAMAYYLTGNASYATHAVKLIEVWFINPATSMNPNMQHAQIQLGNGTGAFYGIIDSRNMYSLCDALGLLSTFSSWTKSDQTAMTAWMGKYLTWLQTSSFGKHEAATSNNHATWFDVQEMGILLYLGKTSEAKSLAEGFGSKRIAPEVTSSGSQPLELSRADGWSYSLFNLQAMIAMADLSARVGVNLWTYKSSGGGSIAKALTYLAPYADSKTAWPHNHLNKTPLSQSDRNGLIPLLLQGESAVGGYTKWIDDLPASTVASNITHLYIDG